MENLVSPTSHFWPGPSLDKLRLDCYSICGQYTLAVGIFSVGPTGFLRAHPVRANMVFKAVVLGHVLQYVGGICGVKWPWLL